MFRVVIVASPLLSFQTPYSLHQVCSIWLIVCSSLIVYTCSSSPCVFSLCVPVDSLPVRLCFPRVSRVPAFSHDFHCSNDNDPCLYNRLRVCLLLAGTFASTTAYLYNDPGLFTRLRDCIILAGTSASTNYYLCDDPGLDKRRSPRPIPDLICLFVFGLSYRVPNPFSKSCYSASLFLSRAFGSYISTYITVTLNSFNFSPTMLTMRSSCSPSIYNGKSIYVCLSE